jgi:hypothetical protein
MEEKPAKVTGKIKDYWPLIALIAVSAAAAFTINSGSGLMRWMHYFMGIFLCNFALLKLFSPQKFADGFQMYDLLAKKSRLYATIYPFLELALGLGYLSFRMNEAVYISSIILFGFSGIGVILSLRKGLKVNCACMGNILQVPLSTVTLTEDIAMVVMAGFMLTGI